MSRRGWRRSGGRVERDGSSEVGRLLEAWRSRTLESEDGGRLTLELNAPAGRDEIERWEQEHGMALPGQLVELLRYSNGASLFGLDLMSLEMMYDSGGLVYFHDWGDGDFDCLDAGGAVYSTDHNPEARTVVAGSLVEWLREVFQEVAARGCLNHPMDYERPGAPGEGVYARVGER